VVHQPNRHRAEEGRSVVQLSWQAEFEYDSSVGQLPRVGDLGDGVLHISEAQAVALAQDDTSGA